MQTKKMSIVESLVNTFSGLFVSFGLQLTVYPAMNIPIRLSQNILITFIFTVVGIARSYIVRRIFNKSTDKKVIPN